MDSHGRARLLALIAMSGASTLAPLTALALVLDLTRDSFALLVPMIVATVIATAAARWINE